MKHSAIIAIGLFLCLSFNLIQAQTNLTNDYIIVSTGNVSETTSYSNALDDANWEPYRLQNQRYQLSFDNGFSIELKSVVEMLNLGYALNLSEYKTENPIGFVPPVLTILSGNTVGMLAKCNQATKQQ